VLCCAVLCCAVLCCAVSVAAAGTVWEVNTTRYTFRQQPSLLGKHHALP
jgi:hypothetical protein